MPSSEIEYAALTTAAGVVDCGERTQLELTGDDRATLLHNLTTNSIRDLRPGEGRETFSLNARGHVIGHFWVFCTPHSLVIDGVPGQAARLLAHFEKYHINERVEFHDRTGDWGDLLLAGPNAAAVLARLFNAPAAEPLVHLAHREIEWSGGKIWIRRADLAEPESYLIAAPREVAPRLPAALVEAGAAACDLPALETARVEAGFPWHGRDITDKNLPQEVGRNRQAISITKGCYLGQETVARIDALGHVNRTLVGVRFDGNEVPAPNDELFTDAVDAGGASVGAVTSAVFSPRLSAPLALAYVRRGHGDAGARLRWRGGPATVIALPLDTSPKR